MNMTTEQRNELIDNYVDRLLDGMDTKDLMQFFIDEMTIYLEKYTDEQLVTEVKEYHPDLLEEN